MKQIVDHATFSVISVIVDDVFNNEYLNYNNEHFEQIYLNILDETHIESKSENN